MAKIEHDGNVEWESRRRRIDSGVDKSDKDKICAIEPEESARFPQLVAEALSYTKLGAAGRVVGSSCDMACMKRHGAP
jgi:hypothetical protein